LIDKDKEIARLAKEKAQCEKEIATLRARLENTGFMAKAPEKVVEDIRAKHVLTIEKLAKIEESIRVMG
ncbi:MAG: hypothetical protein RR395_07755, partial [Ruthenibacterium sp.]